MTPEEKETIDQRFKSVIEEFNEFKISAEKIIKGETSSFAHHRGLNVTPYANAEIILKYILEKENRKIIDKNTGKVKTGKYDLGDYFYALKDKLPEEIHKHIYNIINFRHPSAHGTEISKKDKATITILDASFTVFVNWFFVVYLKNESIDFSKSLYGKPSKHKNLTKVELEEIHRNFEKDPFNISHLSILQQYKKEKKVRKPVTKIISFIIILSILFGIFIIWKKHVENIRLEKVNKTINGYFDKLSESIENDPDEFLADTLDFFYTQPGPRTQKQVVEERFKWKQKHSRSNETNKILGLKFYQDSANISYYHFNVIYKGKSDLPEDSTKPFLRSLARMEIGINKDFKITRLKYLEKPGRPEWSDRPF